MDTHGQHILGHAVCVRHNAAYKQTTQYPACKEWHIPQPTKMRGKNEDDESFQHASSEYI